MRLFIVISALAMMTWSLPVVQQAYTDWLDGVDTVHAEAAIELRCSSEAADFRDECATDLQRDFDLGVRHPEMIVRAHCTQFASDWALSQPAPLSICQELYGGWIKG